MKYILFNWDNVNKDLSDPSELSDEQFIALARLTGGFVFESKEDFVSAFNSEEINTAVHQLRIIQ